MFEDASVRYTRRGMWWESVLKDGVEPDEEYILDMEEDVKVTQESLYAAGDCIRNVLLQTDYRPKLITENFLDVLTREVDQNIDLPALCCQQNPRFTPCSRRFAIGRLCAPPTWVLGRPLSASWLSIFLPESYAWLGCPTDDLITTSWEKFAFFHHLQLTITGIVLHAVFSECNYLLSPEPEPEDEVDRDAYYEDFRRLRLPERWYDDRMTLAVIRKTKGSPLVAYDRFRQQITERDLEVERSLPDSAMNLMIPADFEGTAEEWDLLSNIENVRHRRSAERQALKGLVAAVRKESPEVDYDDEIPF